MNIEKFSDEELLAAYQQVLQARPQLPHYRRARLALIDEMEARGRKQDALAALARRAKHD
jgi:hypothetical protein